MLMRIQGVSVSESAAGAYGAMNVIHRTVTAEVGVGSLHAQSPRLVLARTWRPDLGQISTLILSLTQFFSKIPMLSTHDRGVPLINVPCLSRTEPDERRRRSFGGGVHSGAKTPCGCQRSGTPTMKQLLDLDAGTTIDSVFVFRTRNDGRAKHSKQFTVTAVQPLSGHKRDYRVGGGGCFIFPICN
ncbi:Uncharacterized protein HZ326_2687 [Fusarium oxysporum f. sp. albedinis]|nr:Uncharacterized protein HZ326_2687 [Fusarium oxysporum f. sp. albedinis]